MGVTLLDQGWGAASPLRRGTRGVLERPFHLPVTFEIPRRQLVDESRR